MKFLRLITVFDHGSGLACPPIIAINAAGSIFVLSEEEKGLSSEIWKNFFSLSSKSMTHDARAHAYYSFSDVRTGKSKPP